MAQSTPAAGSASCQAYDDYDFARVVSKLQNFCTNEMGALYLDVTKDRLYTMQVDSHGRRSAQTAMYPSCRCWCVPWRRC